MKENIITYTLNFPYTIFCRQLGEHEIVKKEKASLLANKDETVKTMEMEMQMAKYVQNCHLEIHVTY